MDTGIFIEKSSKLTLLDSRLHIFQKLRRDIELRRLLKPFEIRPAIDFKHDRLPALITNIDAGKFTPQCPRGCFRKLSQAGKIAERPAIQARSGRKVRSKIPRR